MTLLLCLGVLLLDCKNSNKIKPAPVNNEKQKKSNKINSDIKILHQNINMSEVIQVPDDIFENKIDFTQIIDDIDFTILETNNECIIGSINKILSDSNYYFIHDKENDNIFRFSQDGMFINKIGTKGYGPKEYIEAWDISLDIKNNVIIVLDLMGRKIIRYTYNGDFINKSDMPFLYSQLECLDSFIILKTGNATNIDRSIASFQLVFSELNQSPIAKAFPIRKGTYSYTTENPLRKFGSKVYYHNPFSNTIWNINEKEKSLGIPIQLDFGKKTWSSDDLELVSNDTQFRKLLEKYYYFSGNYVFSSTHKFFEIRKKNKGAMLFQNNKSKKILYGSSFVNSEKQLYSILFSNPRWLRFDDKFITIKQPYEIAQWKEYILKNDIDKLTQFEKDKINSINAENNPILVIFSLRDF